MTRGGHPHKKIAIAQIAINKKRMTNLFFMGIPPYLFYIYMILDSVARKIFKEFFRELLFWTEGVET